MKGREDAMKIELDRCIYSCKYHVFVSRSDGFDGYTVADPISVTWRRYSIHEAAQRSEHIAGNLSAEDLRQLYWALQSEMIRVGILDKPINEEIAAKEIQLLRAELIDVRSVRDTLLKIVARQEEQKPDAGGPDE
jgi:hypothetical protein